MRLHATAVALDGKAVLLRGESGSGKSDLALRLIDRGWQLVGDDQVHLEQAAGGLIVRGDERLSGLLEVRGLGLVTLPVCPQAPVALIVDLGSMPERLPTPVSSSLLGVACPFLLLNAFEPSAPIKLEWALKDPSRIGRDRGAGD